MNEFGIENNENGFGDEQNENGEEKEIVLNEKIKSKKKKEIFTRFEKKVNHEKDAAFGHLDMDYGTRWLEANSKWKINIDVIYYIPKQKYDELTLEQFDNAECQEIDINNVKDENVLKFIENIKFNNKRKDNQMKRLNINKIKLPSISCMKQQQILQPITTPITATLPSYPCTQFTANLQNPTPIRSTITFNENATNQPQPNTLRNQHKKPTFDESNYLPPLEIDYDTKRQSDDSDSEFEPIVRNTADEGMSDGGGKRRSLRLKEKNQNKLETKRSRQQRITASLKGDIYKNKANDNDNDEPEPKRGRRKKVRTRRNKKKTGKGGGLIRAEFFHLYMVILQQSIIKVYIILDYFMWMI